MSKKTKKMKRDKIFNNDYNTGNIEFEMFGKIKVQDDYNTFSKKITDDSYNEWERKQLQNLIYKIYESTELKEKYEKVKKIPKDEMVEVYYFISDKLAREKFTAVQIFTEICEFMNFSYKEMFERLLPAEKQAIINEMNKEYNVLKNIKRLF